MNKIQRLPLVLIAASILLLGLSTPIASAQQNLVSIGVGDIQSSIRGADPASFQSMLETQLIKTNKFKIIERSRLAEILKEKGLSMMGITDGQGTLSGLSGVGYLVYGTITKLGASGRNMSFGGFGISNSKVEMAVDLRVVDASTGEMRYADTVQETANGSQNATIGGMHTGDSASDPLADVERLTAKAITSLIVTTIYPIKVIAVQGDGTIVVNYGDSVLTAGDQLRVFELGESFKDPDTGKVLGAEEKQVALLRVTEVTPKFSKASLLQGAAKVGNIARRLSTSDVAKSGAPQQGGQLP